MTEGPASVEVSVEKEQEIVWLRIETPEDAMEIGVPVEHAYMISQALHGACTELGYDPKKDSN